MIIYRERFHHEIGFSVSQFTLVAVPAPVPVPVPDPYPFPVPDSGFRISWFSIRPFRPRAVVGYGVKIFGPRHLITSPDHLEVIFETSLK